VRIIQQGHHNAPRRLKGRPGSERSLFGFPVCTAALGADVAPMIWLFALAGVLCLRRGGNGGTGGLRRGMVIFSRRRFELWDQQVSPSFTKSLNDGDDAGRFPAGREMPDAQSVLRAHRMSTS